MSYNLLRYIYFIFFILLFGRIIGVYFRTFGEFMFNQESSWYDKKVEKPRLFFHIIAFMFLLGAFIPILGEKGQINFGLHDCLIISLSIMLLSMSALSVVFSWSAIFRNKFIPKVESVISSINFKLILKDDLDKETIISNCIVDKYIAEDSEASLRELLENGSCQTPIIWIKTTLKSKAISYVDLFRFMESISSETTGRKRGIERKAYVNFLVENFKKENSEFDREYLNKAYTNWN